MYCINSFSHYEKQKELTGKYQRAPTSKHYFDGYKSVQNFYSLSNLPCPEGASLLTFPWLPRGKLLTLLTSLLSFS